MADLDLTEAVEAAAEAVKTESLTSRSTAPGWVVVTGHATSLARAAVEAAAPLIAARVRAETLLPVHELNVRHADWSTTQDDYPTGSVPVAELWKLLERLAASPAPTGEAGRG